jgi:hypothetical protein
MAHRRCEALARALPHGVTFAGLEAHAYCGRAHRIARFRLHGGDDATEFVLVPGSKASLGFDGNDFRPTEQQIESFTQSAEEYGIGASIREFVDSQTSTQRVAHVAPTLFEVEAREISVERVDPDDPAFDELRRRLHGKGPTRMEHTGGHLDGYILERDAGGSCRAWRRLPTT